MLKFAAKLTTLQNNRLQVKSIYAGFKNINYSGTQPGH